MGTGRAGGSGILVSTGGAGENVSSLSTTNSSGIGRAGGLGCLVSGDGDGFSKDDVNHGKSWAGGPGDQLYIVSTGNTDNSSKTVHQFNKNEKQQPQQPFTIFDDEYKVMSWRTPSKFTLHNRSKISSSYSKKFANH